MPFRRCITAPQNPGCESAGASTIDHIGFVLVGEGLVWLIPVTDHTHATEAGFLQFDLLSGVLTTPGAECGGIQFLSHLAEFLLYL